MLENYYISGLPIKLDGTLGTIYQPTIKTLIENDYTELEFLQPFLIHTGLYEVLEENNGEIKNFDLFYFENLELFISLVKGLKLFYRASDEDITLEGKEIIIKKDIRINRDNFDYLAEVILEMFMTKRPEKEDKSRKYEDDTRQKLWDKIRKKREEASKKNALQICDIINIICHINGFVPYTKVLDLTYYQLINSYQMLVRVDSYRDFIQYKVSSKFDIKQDAKHWLKEAKIKRSEIKKNF